MDNELKIELTPEVARGTYSNLAIISHSPNEVYIDFINAGPNMPKAIVQDRIIMTPENAKNLMMALIDNIKKYEQTFGEIRHRQPLKPQNPGDIPNPFAPGSKLN